MELAIIAVLALLLLSGATAAAASPTAGTAVQASDSSGLASTLGSILSSPAEGTNTPNVAAQQASGLAEKTGIGLAGVAGTAAATGASVGAALGTAALTAGIGAVAFFGVEGAINLFKCGTIGSIGCEKTHDEKLQEQGVHQMRLAMYAVESGRAAPAAAAPQITTLATQIQAGYQRKASGDNVGLLPNSGSDIPDSALASQYLVGMAMPLATIAAKFVAFLPVLQAKAAGKPYILPQPFNKPVQPTLAGGSDDEGYQGALGPAPMLRRPVE